MDLVARGSRLAGVNVLHLLPPERERAGRVRAVVAALEPLGVGGRTWEPPDDGRTAGALWQRLGAVRADLVHAHGGGLAATWRARAGRPVVVTRWDEPDPLAGEADQVVPAPDADPGAAAARWQACYTSTLARSRTARADEVGDERPWGRYRVLDQGPGFKVKRVEVHAGRRLSYQRHARREEHWLIVSGRARVTLDGREEELGAGQRVCIPPGTAHRIESLGPEAVTFVEVQRGDYFGEDDIERLQDDFGRA